MRDQVISINDLPLELLDCILGWVTLLDHVVCAHVSRTWRDVVASIHPARHRVGDHTKVDFIAEAVRSGQWHRVEWARRRGCPWSDQAPTAAIESGHSHLFARLLSEGCPLDAKTCAIAAAKKGDTNSLIAVIDTQSLGRRAGEEALEAAAAAGQNDALALLFAHDNGCNGDSCWASHLVVWPRANKKKSLGCTCAHYVGRRAAGAGHTKTLAWLFDHGCRFDDMAAACAAEGGHIDTLEWLYDHDAPFNSFATDMAAEGGQLDALKWLYDHDCPWESSTCLHAVYGGHIDVLEWAMANDCPWEPLATTFAVIGGHIDVAKWLLAQGCPLVTESDYTLTSHPSHLALVLYDDTVMDIVASHGRVDLLEWLLAHGCRATVCTFVQAAKNMHFDALDWLNQHCMPWDETVCARIAYQDALPALQHLRAQGCPWDERVYIYAAQGKQLPTMQWARANGCPWDANSLCLEVSAYASRDVMRWLMSEGCAWDDRVALRMAAGNGDGLDPLM
jgi:hypothetical protein